MRILQIIYWKQEDHPGEKPPLNGDVNEAAKNIVMMDLAILAEAAAGMYKKPVEALAREFRYDSLPPEVRTVVIAAWTPGGLLPRTAIEQMVPAAPVVVSETSSGAPDIGERALALEAVADSSSA